MKDLYAQLKRKIKAIQEYYVDIAKENDQGNMVEIEERHLFDSMQRWHENSHMSSHNWINLFGNIKEELHIDLNELKLDIKNREFESLLEAKLNCEELTSRMIVSDLFCEDYLDQIRKFYQTLLDEQRDEFDVDFIGDRTSKELMFFQRVFLPTAVFLTYRQKHNTGNTEQLFHECFSIGSGSKNLDLIPEVNAFCIQCSDNAEFKNRMIYCQQVKNKFKTVSYYSSDSSDEDQEVALKKCNSVRSDFFNPFALSDSSDSSDGNDTEVDGLVSQQISDSLIGDSLCVWKCIVCSKEFSKEKFKNIHELIFHSAKLTRVELEHVTDTSEAVITTSFTAAKGSTTRVEYVDAPEEVITSFIAAKRSTTRVEYVNAPEEVITSFIAAEGSTPVKSSVLGNKGKIDAVDGTRRDSVRRSLRFVKD